MAYENSGDLAIMNAEWYYTYSVCNDPRCVPMSWCGEDPKLTTDYDGFVLLFNEPENPAQCNISPQTGIDRYRTLVEKYPNAKWVVGNSIFWGNWSNWLYQFRDLCVSDGLQLPYAWGVHIYIRGSSSTWIPYIRDAMNRLHDGLGGTFWITEFAEINGNINTDDAMVRYFESEPWIERYAYFTNRAKGDEPWYPVGWNVQLFDWDTGVATQIGNWYANGLHQTFLPMVSSGGH